jgi:hypothetical protein
VEPVVTVLPELDAQRDEAIAAPVWQAFDFGFADAIGLGGGSSLEGGA